MNPFYSDSDKVKAVEKFIYARSIRKAFISTYKPIKECLVDGRIKTLTATTKSGQHTESTYPYKKSFYYTDGDAQSYFERLVAIVSGTEEEAVSEELFKKAVNQLFMFIFGLSGTLQSTVDLLESLSLDEKTKLENQIVLVDKKVDHIDEQIVTALETIIRWQQKYQPYLNKLAKDQQNLEKALRGKGRGKT
jgi:hypothetical protein